MEVISPDLAAVEVLLHLAFSVCFGQLLHGTLLKFAS